MMDTFILNLMWIQYSISWIQWGKRMLKPWLKCSNKHSAVMHACMHWLCLALITISTAAKMKLGLSYMGRKNCSCILQRVKVTHCMLKTWTKLGVKVTNMMCSRNCGLWMCVVTVIHATSSAFSFKKMALWPLNVEMSVSEVPLTAWSHSLCKVITVVGSRV